MLLLFPRAHTVIKVTIEYLPLTKPIAANILTLLIQRLELSFDIKRFNDFAYQHKYHDY